MAGCNCATFGGNIGLPSCIETQNGSAKLLLAPILKANGERFSIPQGQLIDQTYLDSLVYAENPADRIYPLEGLMQRVENVRADAEVETFDAGVQRIIRKGAKTFDAILIDKAVPKYIGQLEGFDCVEFGFYTIDNSGNVRGTADAACTVLYPTKVAKNTMNVNYVEGSSSTIPAISISFQWSPLELDMNQNMFIADSIEADMINTQGLIDAEIAEVIPPSITAVTVAAKMIYGDMSNGKQPVTGLEAADIVLRNLTQGDTVTIDTVTETPTGTYLIDYTTDTQTIGDILQLESSATTGVLDTAPYEIVKTPLTAIA